MLAFNARAASLMRDTRLKPTFLIPVFFIPLALLADGMTAPLLFVVLILQYIVLPVERWFFFAEAYHPQNLYYQGIY